MRHHIVSLGIIAVTIFSCQAHNAARTSAVQETPAPAKNMQSSILDKLFIQPIVSSESELKRMIDNKKEATAEFRSIAVLHYMRMDIAAYALQRWYTHYPEVIRSENTVQTVLIAAKGKSFSPYTALTSDEAKFLNGLQYNEFPNAFNASIAGFSNDLKTQMAKSEKFQEQINKVIASSKLEKVPQFVPEVDRAIINRQVEKEIAHVKAAYSLFLDNRNESLDQFKPRFNIMFPHQQLPGEPLREILRRAVMLADGNAGELYVLRWKGLVEKYPVEE